MTATDHHHAPDALETDQLLTWASTLKFADLPSAAIESLRDDLVDGLGCGAFGSTLPATVALRDLLLGQAAVGGPCTVWGTSSRASALDAVVINAAGQNGFELDDYCGLVRGVHGSVTVYPVIMAVAELTHDVSGQDFMAAAAAGWETATRMSLAMGPTVLDRGFYMTPMYSTLGSAVAAGRALHLDPKQMTECFNLALLHASGLAITTEEGMGKPLSSGEAVRSGLLCALLASKGARGPRSAYGAPRKGFAAVYSTPEERNDAALLIEHGEELACETIGFKAYASCGAGQVVTDIMTDLMTANPSVGPDTVQSVELRINATSAGHIGAPYEPKDATNAQFSMAYCIAAQLLEGDNSAHQFRDELLADPRILDITRRVEVIPDPTVGVASTRLRNEAYVKVNLSDGTTLEGHAETNRAINRSGLRQKYAGLASTAISSDAANKLVASIDDLENLSDTAILAGYLSTQ